jgi:uncharacterized cupin superfamily protein
MPNHAFDLSTTYVHLGLGSKMAELADFSWSADHLRQYVRSFAADGGEGRLVGIIHVGRTWDHWECHRGGDELVVQLSGSCDVIQELDGELHTITLTPGQAMINPRGVWHTSDVHEPGESLFIAGGRRTVYRPRTEAATPSVTAPAPD